MSLTEFQQFVEDKFIDRGIPLSEQHIIEAVLGLASESGEVAGKFSKSLRGDYNDKTIDQFDHDTQLELGDVFFYLMMLHSAMKLNWQETLQKNVDKLNSRTARGVVQGFGDHR